MFSHLEDINPHYPDVFIKRLLSNVHLQSYADTIMQQAQTSGLEFILIQLADSTEFEILMEYNKYDRTLLIVYYQLLGKDFFEMRSNHYHDGFSYIYIEVILGLSHIAMIHLP